MLVQQIEFKQSKNNNERKMKIKIDKMSTNKTKKERKIVGQ